MTDAKIEDVKMLRHEEAGDLGITPQINHVYKFSRTYLHIFN